MIKKPFVILLLSVAAVAVIMLTITLEYQPVYGMIFYLAVVAICAIVAAWIFRKKE